jgi:hypothetical protein
VRVIDLLQSVSSQLNDQRPGAEFYRWTVPMLLSYMNTGIPVISQIRQDANTFPPQAVTLVPGTVQAFPAGLSSVSSINGPAGSLTEYDQITASIPDDPCIAVVNTDCNGDPIPYVPLGYSLTTSPPGFRIFPPVPEGLTPAPTVTVSGNPGPYTNTSLTLFISGQYIPCLEAWMLYKAYSVDMESATSLANSTNQYRVFKDLLYGGLQAEVALKNNRALRP